MKYLLSSLIILPLKFVAELMDHPVLESCLELSEVWIPKWMLLNSKKCNLSSPYGLVDDELARPSASLVIKTDNIF